MNKQPHSKEFDFRNIKCVVFDFGFTLSSDLYFNISPPGYPQWQEIIQQRIFSRGDLVNEWMKGGVAVADIAKILSAEIDLSVSEITKCLRMGCENLRFNEAVLEFALTVKERGIRTAIVTVNMDVFTEVVVPSHNLDTKFDVIVNSYDYQELDKEILWPKAFEKLGNGIEYGNSLLLDDKHHYVVKFRDRGGYAYEYQNDEAFIDWLDGVDIE